MQELELQRFVEIFIRPVKFDVPLLSPDGSHPRKRILAGEILYRLGDINVLPDFEIPICGSIG
jgi:hypothetical protein